MRNSQKALQYCVSACLGLMLATVASHAQVATAKGGGHRWKKTPDQEAFEARMIAESKPVISPWEQFSEPSDGVKWLSAYGPRLRAGDGNAVYESADNGKSWSMLTGEPAGEFRNQVFDGVDGMTLTVSGGVPIAIDDNTGAETKGSGMHANPQITAAVRIDATIYAATDRGIYTSTDYGSNWALAAAPYPAGNENVAGANTESIGGLVAREATLFALSGGKVFRSNDHAATWSAADKGMKRGYPVSCLREMDGKLIAGSRGMGVYISDDGESWKSCGPSSQGNCQGPGCLPRADIVGVEPFGSYLFCVTSKGAVFFSRNRGYSWGYACGGLPDDSCIRGVVACGEYAYAWDNAGRAFRVTRL
jgi:hypothetical protein